MPLIKILMNLPFTGTYSYLYRLLEGYCSYFRLFPRKMSPGAFIRNIYYHLHHDRA
jgi:hypothetical protein